MSLINQMLRDLEKRRRTEERQLPSGEEPRLVDTRNSQRRAFFLGVGGALLIGLVWLGLDFFPPELMAPKAEIKLVPADEKSQQVAIVRGEELFAALEEKQVRQASVAPVVSSEQLKAKPPLQKAASAKIQLNQPATPEVKFQAASGVYSSALLNLGVLETVGSARLMFEFEQLPEYRWQFLDEDQKQLRIQFEHAGARSTLKVPYLKGPLLKQISMRPTTANLLIDIEVSKEINVQTLELPADPFHGHRLLVEVYMPDAVAAAGAAVEQSSSAAAPVNLPTAKAAPTAKKFSRKESGLSREEQAEQAYQSSLEMLRRKEYPAAEETLSHALVLQPRLLDARLQLIDLLQKLQRNSEAEKQLLQGLQLHADSPELRKKYARQLLGEGQLTGAIDILLSEPQPEVGSDLEYHALLAALQQEAGRYQEAVKSYLKLLKYRPQEALWWMGLAISYDQSGDYRRAKEAYEQALTLPGLRPDLNDYIRNRLQVL